MCCELTPALQQFPSSLQAFTTLLLFFRIYSIYQVFPEFPSRTQEKLLQTQEMAPEFRYISQRPRDANTTSPLNTTSRYHIPVHHTSLLQLHACSMLTTRSLQSPSWLCPVPKQCFALKIPQRLSMDTLHKNPGQAGSCLEKVSSLRGLYAWCVYRENR